MQAPKKWLLSAPPGTDKERRVTMDISFLCVSSPLSVFSYYVISSVYVPPPHTNMYPLSPSLSP